MLVLLFFGIDIWNVYELLWFNVCGKLQVVIVMFYVLVELLNIVELKLFKLYFGLFVQLKFDLVDVVCDVLKCDVLVVCGVSVLVQLVLVYDFCKLEMDEFDGLLFDWFDFDVDVYEFDLLLLLVVDGEDEVLVEEMFVFDLLCLNCLVMGQFDWGSVQIYYVGLQIDYVGLLCYIILFCNYMGFYEQCVEWIFFDIMYVCKLVKFVVYVCYMCCGGFDINLFCINYNQLMLDNVWIVWQ